MQEREREKGMSKGEKLFKEREREGEREREREGEREIEIEGER